MLGWTFGGGTLALFAIMGALWWTHGRKGNAGIVDVAWTLGVGGLALAYCLVPSDGDGWRRVVLGVIVTLWSVRLAGHIWHRVQRMPEDGRYLAMKEYWGERAPAKMLGFFFFQAIAAALFSLPMLLAAGNATPFGVWDYVAIAIAVVAIGGEAVADRQLQAFREVPTNRGRTCRVGLWRYSRHPNYFFEWLHWFVYAALAITAPLGWLALLAPFAMLYFILCVTGIPPTERQALKSRGQDYINYQRETSAFFPWPPKPLVSNPAGGSTSGDSVAS